MTPDMGGQAGWAQLATRLNAAAGRAAEAVRMAPLSAAAALLEPLREVAACLAEAEQLCRAGRHEGIEPFRQELERWALAMPGVHAWMHASSGLASGWAAAAGISSGYGPGGAGRPEAGPGQVNERG